MVFTKYSMSSSKKAHFKKHCTALFNTGYTSILFDTVNCVRPKPYQYWGELCHSPPPAGTGSIPSCAMHRQMFQTLDFTKLQMDETQACYLCKPRFSQERSVRCPSVSQAAERTRTGKSLAICQV